MLWVLFVVLLLFKRSLANMVAIAVVTLGLTNTHGIPSFTPEYVQNAMYDDNFVALPYVGICMMIGSRNFALYIPLIMHAFLQSGRILKTYLNTLSYTFIPKVTTLIHEGLRSKLYLIEVKADIEVYLGFYIVIAWFFNRSHLISIVFYWQLLRIKYMLG